MAHSPLDHVVDHAWVGPVTKYQILIVVAAVAVAVPYILLARRVENGAPPRGPFWNFLEMLLLFIRDEVVRPNVGPGHSSHDAHDAGDDPAHPHHHQADKYLPFLWTLFLFILACNLLGMVPFLGSPTADLGVTLTLAVMTFLVIHVSALMKLGPVKYVRSYIPVLKGDNLVMNVFLAVVITPMIAAIEVLGAFIRGAVLAIRLFANIFAGHVALAVIVAFAVAADNSFSPGGGLAALVLGTGLSLLELFVAFLQAFVFVLLASIFLGMQLNPEH
ncbi:MAG: F0F1 ATP synthase subunit A [Gemmataceae bacterium]|nr:F0F1 ATP synthase subunit A [Gemmataceae bacterium]